MRPSTWILFIAALALVLGVGAMVSRQSRVTPEEFFQAVEKRIAEGRYDRDQTLLNLDQVLSRAREANDKDLESRVLLRRGRLLIDIRAWDRARTDLLAVAEQRPGDPAVEADLVELETRAGDFAAAEARVRRGLERDPGSPDAWARLGRLHRLAAAEHEESAARLLVGVLAPDDYAVARAALALSVALDPEDTARPALAERVRSTLAVEDEELAQQVLRLADRAAVASRAARDGFAQALEHASERGLQIEALAGLLDLFRAAGRTDLAVDLATSALRFEAVRTDPAIGRVLMQSLLDLGRLRYGGALAQQWSQRHTPADASFYELMARIGIFSERWDLMVVAGQEMHGVGSADDEIASHFYVGVGAVARGEVAIANGLLAVGQREVDGGRARLRRFVTAQTPEPVPLARAIAWRSIARASRVLGEPEVEREALQGAVDLDPDHDGELWLRLAELQMAAPHGGFRQPETRFAKGMSLLPRRTEELLPRWHAIGERELASINFDPDSVRAALERNKDKVWLPSSDASPYELFRLAEIHFAANDDARAAAHLERLLELVPGFLPALDLSIRVWRRQRDPDRLLGLVAARLRAAGRTEETTEILRAIPLDELKGGDLQRLMRADPEYFGRVGAADALTRHGRSQEALALLGTIDPATFGDEARLLVARLSAAQGDPARVLEVLNPIGRGLVAIPGAIELAVRGALWSDAPEDVRSLLNMATRDPRLSLKRKLALADAALAAGAVDPARDVYRTLDKVQLFRSGDLCVRLATAAALAGNPSEVARALARSEAFETAGSTERAALAIALHTGRTGDLKSLAQRAAEKSRAPGPILETAYLLMQDRTAEASALLAAVRSAGRDEDPRWAILTECARALGGADAPDAAGTSEFDPRLGRRATAELAAFVRESDGARDPRALAGWIAATVMNEGQAFAIAHFERGAAGAEGALWPAWLAADLRLRQGNVHGARKHIDAVLALAPDFAPAWAAQEGLDPEMRRDPRRYGLFRGARLQALGAAAGTPMERREDRARFLLASGDARAAAAMADGTDPEEVPSGELAAIAGRAALALERPREAVERFARALAAKDPPADVSGCIRDLLEAVERAQDSADPLPRSAAQSVIAQLAARHGDDPRLVLAIARVALTEDPRNPALGVQRAIAQLVRFRQLHAGHALDERAPGAAAAWIEFLSQIDAERAQALAREELDLAPGELSTWIAAARVHAAGKEPERALEELRLVQRIQDDSRVAREILRLRAAADMDPADIAASVTAIVALEGRELPDPSLRLLAARSYLNHGPRLTGQALAAAQRAREDPHATEPQRQQAARLAAIGFLMRSQAADVAQAAELLTGVQLEHLPPIEADCVRALRGLARHTSKP